MKTCFVIMPFSGTTDGHTESYWTEFYTNFLKPQIERHGYLCLRSQANPEAIVKGILKYLFESDLVVAVLTDFNANVWYELGIRHSFRKGTVMMIEKGQKLPFDISSYGVIVYDDTLKGMGAFEQNLKQFIDRIEKDQPIDSPAQEFLGPRLRLELDKQRDKIETELEQKVNEVRKSLENPSAELRVTPRGVGRQRILWVDDNPSNNLFLIEEYRKQGVQFDLALTTKQAMDFLAENLGSYDLIISDMGRANEPDAGNRLLSAIGAYHTAAPPVVIFSVPAALKVYGEKAKSLGAADITSSPRQVARWIAGTSGTKQSPERIQ